MKTDYNDVKFSLNIKHKLKRNPTVKLDIYQ